MKPRTRAQLRMMAKPSRKAVAANLAAQAPDGWQPPESEKRRAAKIVQEPIPEMGKDEE